MDKLVCVCLLLLSHLCVRGQAFIDSMAVDEMKQGFKAGFLDGRLPDTTLYDRLSCDKRKRGIVTRDSKIRTTPFGTLPPADYWLKQGKNGRDTLCLVGFRQKTKRERRLWKHLAKRYGETIIPVERPVWEDEERVVADTVSAIPARWATTRLTYFFNHERCGQEIVARFPNVAQVDGGIVRSVVYGDGSLQTGLWTSRLYHDYRDIAQTDYWLDAPGYRRTAHEVEGMMNLFAHDVNQRVRPGKNSPAKPFALSALLWFDGQRCCHLERLLPEDLPAENEPAFRELKRVVESMPPGLFDSFLTAEGKVLPGIYLHARFSRQKWSFRDWRFMDDAPD